MEQVKQFLQNNNLRDAEDMESLLELASLMRQLIDNDQHSGICDILHYTIANSYFEALVWCLNLLQEALEQEESKLHSFECAIGRSLPHYDALIGLLQVDLHAPENGLERIFDKNGEVESFFNILTYQTGYNNIRFVSAENFDTKDNDFVQYKLAFVKG